MAGFSYFAVSGMFAGMQGMRAAGGTLGCVLATDRKERELLMLFSNKGGSNSNCCVQLVYIVYNVQGTNPTHSVFNSATTSNGMTIEPDG